MSIQMPTRQKFEKRQSGAPATLSKSDPQSKIHSIATVQNLTQTNMGQKITLQVRLPTQETMILQFERKFNSVTYLKKLLSQKLGLPDTESLILSHQGKSLSTT